MKIYRQASIIWILLILSFSISCKKESHQDDPKPTPIQYCQNYHANSNGDTLVYLFLDNKLVAQLQYQRNSLYPSDSSSFIYEANSIKIKSYTNYYYWKLTAETEINLGANGLATSEKYRSYGSNGEIHRTYYYFYDNENYLIKRITESTLIEANSLENTSSDTLIKVITNGNITSDTLKWSVGLIKSTSYNYFLDKENKSIINNNDTYGGLYFYKGFEMYGKTTKNLCSSSESVSNIGDGEMNSQYSYTLDSNGYVKKISRLQLISGDPLLTDYHYYYNCY